MLLLQRTGQLVKILGAHVMPFGSCSPVASCSRQHARWGVRCQPFVLTAGAAVGTKPIDSKVLLTACLHPKLGIAFKHNCLQPERVAEACDGQRPVGLAVAGTPT